MIALLAAIATLLTAIIGLAVYLIKRHNTQDDDPGQQNLDRKAEADRAIADRDIDAVNLQLESDIRRLQNARRNNPGR